MQNDLPGKPIVDIIIPTYNYGDKVSRAIKSVKDQTLTNFHCYIVDDGSTDDTKKIVQKEIRGDERFTYIYQDNKGVANARNKGVFSGNGKYVCCLDADDAIRETFLETCVIALEEDPTISIAYTGLWYIKPNGEEGLSPWPGEFNYDEQVAGRNQIPTCNVSRKKVWERLGGQRQRYAPYGAGEEDAEMWLRAGAYGFRAKQVSTEGLFVYSWLSGRVSGSKGHQMTDYRSYHPWTQDGKHPFISIATPAKTSHSVRQYDEPIVSVVIPVGPGHSECVIDALDSLESQTFRNWEAILVWDNQDSYEFLEKTYPYIRFVTLQKSNSPHGAGYSRNRGADIARGNFVVFLDADDWLVNNALERMLSSWEYDQAIIFTDHYGKAIMSQEDAQELGDRLLGYNEKTKYAIFKHGWKAYECNLAQRQPDKDRMYHWCLVTTLIPKIWHDEIGGFDENMESWEDWDYYIRMAKAGKCFVRVPEYLVVYRYDSGNRRELGVKQYQDLIQYMLDKYKGTTNMPCNCKGNQSTAPVLRTTPTQQVQQGETMNDSDFALITYNHPNKGQHRVIGPATRLDYSYRSGGDRFLVHTKDIELQPHIFTRQESIKVPPKTEEIVPIEIQEEESESFDLQVVGGVSDTIVHNLNALGVHSIEELVEFGEKGLMQLKGIGERRANAIIVSAKGILEERKNERI